MEREIINRDAIAERLTELLMNNECNQYQTEDELKSLQTEVGCLITLANYCKKLEEQGIAF